MQVGVSLQRIDHSNVRDCSFDCSFVLHGWCRSKKRGSGREIARAWDVVDTRGCLAGAISDWSHKVGYRDWYRVRRLDIGAEWEARGEASRLEGCCRGPGDVSSASCKLEG